MFEVNTTLMFGYALADKAGESFKYAVRNFFARPFHDLPRVRLSSFLIFDKMIGRFWAASSRKDKGTEECPLQWQMLGMVQYGYLILTERMAQQVWGEDHPLYLAIKAKLDFTQARAARGRFPKPTAKKFRLMFDLTQADLLEWAGVPEDKAIELPK